MKSFGKMVLSGMLSLMLTGFARGENSENSQPFQRGLVELSLQSGISWTNLDYGTFWFKNDNALAPLFQLSGLYEVTSWLSMGAEIGFPTQHKVNTSNRPLGNGAQSSESKRTITQFTPEIEIGPWLGRTKPYLMLGGGLYHVKDDIDFRYYIPGPPFSSGIVQNSESRNLGGFNAGLGILFRVTDHVALGPDLRYHHIYDAGESYYYGTATARITVLF